MAMISRSLQSAGKKVESRAKVTTRICLQIYYIHIYTYILHNIRIRNCGNIQHHHHNHYQVNVLLSVVIVER